MPWLRTAALFAFLLALPAPGLAAPNTPPAPRNLLINPGFEESLADHPWMPAGWDSSAAGIPTVFFGRDTMAAHSGSFAVSVASASALIPIAHNWHQAVLIQPKDCGQDVVFTIWTRSLGVEGRAYVMVQAYRDTISKMAKIWKMDRDAAAKKMRITRMEDPLYDLGWKRLYFTEEETPWVQRQVRVFVPPGSNMLFVRCGIHGTGQLMLDDASLSFAPARPAPEVPLRQNLLTDGGFEGDLLSWEISMPPYENIVARPDSAAPRSGRRSMLFDGSQAVAMIQGRTGVSQVISNHNLAGKHVRLNGYVKTDSTESLAYARIYAHTLHGVFQALGTTSFSGTNDWRPITVDMNLPEDTYSVWAWFAYSTPTPGRLRIDDVSLEAMGDADPSVPPAFPAK